MQQFFMQIETFHRKKPASVKLSSRKRFKIEFLVKTETERYAHLRAASMIRTLAWDVDHSQPSSCFAGFRLGAWNLHLYITRLLAVQE